MKIGTWTVKKFIILILAVSAVISMLLIWPGNAMKDTAVSSSGAEANKSTGNLTAETYVIQTFVPEYSYMRSIGLLIDTRGGESDAGNFLLEIYDSANNVQKQVNFTMNKVGDKSKGYFTIPLNLKVIAGAPYYFKIYAYGTEEEPVSLLYRGRTSAGPKENYNLFYAGADLGDASLACCYTYGSLMGKRQILVYDMFFLALFFVGKAFVEWLSKKKEVFQQSLSWSSVLRISGTAVCSWAWIISFYYTFIKKIFGGELLDFAVYGAGFTIGLLIAFYGIWNLEWKFEKSGWKELLPETVRVVSFAYYFTMYADYFNSGSNYGHYVAICKMSTAFALVVLSYLGIKELWNRRNLLYTVLYGIGVGGYCLSQARFWNEEGRTLHMLFFIALWFWGLVLIYTVVQWVQKKRPCLSVSYGTLVSVFFGLMCIFQQKKGWPVIVALLFGLLYLQNYSKSRMLGLVKSFCMGTMVSFLYMWGWCMLYRPYQRHEFSRYALAFTSVAIDALYLVFIFCGVILLTVEQYRKDGRLKKMWFYYMVVGAVCSYLFMSVSRTAMLTVVILLFLLGIILFLGWYRGQVKKILAFFGMLALSFVLMFPVCYTMTRCIPAIVSKPHYNPYEEFEGGIGEGERKDSPQYMDFESFLELSMGRFLVTIQGIVGSEASDDDVTQNNVTILEIGSEIASVRPEEELRQVLLASAAETGQSNEAAGELSNGRFDIYKLYFSRLNMTGHDNMVITENNVLYAHAHNTFLQVAYDHGIPCGIVFLLLGLVTFLRGVVYILRNKEEGVLVAAPVMFLIIFAVTGMAEWVFHPAIPLGFGVLFMVKPLLTPLKKEAVQE